MSAAREKRRSEWSEARALTAQVVKLMEAKMPAGKEHIAPQVVSDHLHKNGFNYDAEEVNLIYRIAKGERP